MFFLFQKNIQKLLHIYAKENRDVAINVDFMGVCAVALRNFG
jgi:hypothetical protein